MFFKHLIALCFGAVLVSAAVPTAPTPSVNDSLARRSGHPYLTYSDANIAQLKERIKQEPVIAEAWDRMLTRANDVISQSARLRVSRGRPTRDVGLLCLAYRMTGDKKFGQRVKDYLMDRTLGGRSDPLLLLRDPPWNVSLGSGEACEEFGVAFDSVYDLLTPEERKTLATKLAETGILPVLNDWVLGERRIHSLDTMGHNWWSAIVFGAGIGAMAILDEEPQAHGWVERLAAAETEWLSFAGSLLSNKPGNFDREGGFYESIGYAGYAIRSHLPFRLAWRDAFVEPLPDHPVLAKIAGFFIHTSYPRSGGAPWALDFGDSGLSSSGADSVAMLWKLGYRSSEALWYLNQFEQSGEGRRGREPSAGPLLQAPEDLLYAPGADDLASAVTSPSLPREKIFEDIGWVTFRSSWDKDATMLGIKSGYSWNHAHADAGSFVLFHQGEYVLIDSGKSGYSTPEYDGYYRQSMAHNVVTFNGKAEHPDNTYFGSKFPGTVSQLIGTDTLRFVLADATGPTADTFVRNYRSFLWVGDVILVIDDLKTYEPGQFEWLLHYNGEGRRQGLDFTVTEGNAKVVVRPLFPMPFPDAGLPTDYPENMRLVEKVGKKTGEPNVDAPFVAFAPTELMRRTKFITAIMPLPQGDWTPPKIERLQTLDMIGLRITQQGKVTEVWLNLLADGRVRHRNANLVYDGWETDAYLTAFTWPEGADLHDPDAATETLIANGSYLRRGDKLVLDSLSKVYLSADRNGDKLEVKLRGQPVINAWFRSPTFPRALTVNGEAIDTPFDADRKTVRLSVRPQ